MSSSLSDSYLPMFLKEVVFVSMNGIDDSGQDRGQPVSYRQICKRSWGGGKKKNKDLCYVTRKELIYSHVTI